MSELTRIATDMLMLVIGDPERPDFSALQKAIRRIKEVTGCLWPAPSA
jgi:hypothetical protein